MPASQNVTLPRWFFLSEAVSRLFVITPNYIEHVQFSVDTSPECDYSVLEPVQIELVQKGEPRVEAPASSSYRND